MNIPERVIKIAVSDAVTEFRHYYFNPETCPDFTVAYIEAKAKLAAFASLFPEGKLAKYISSYVNELEGLNRLVKAHIRQASRAA